MLIRTTARSILGLACAALSMAAAAQTDPGETNTVVGTATNVFSADSAQINTMMQERERRLDTLRRELADPVKGPQVRAELQQRVRADHPDLAKVMRLDAASEAKLLELLTDHRLAFELRPNGFADVGFDPDNRRIAPDVLDHTARMREIAARLGTQLMDDYVDYLGTLRERQRVEQLNNALPASNKLGFAQKERFIAVLIEAEERSNLQLQMRLQTRWLTGRERIPSINLPPAERERRTRIRNITLNESAAYHRQQDHSELLQDLATVLIPAQSAVLAAQLRKEVDDLLAWTRERRRELGIDPQQVLADPEPKVPAPPPLTRDVELALELTINTNKLLQKVTSVQGAPVSFEGPDGLLLMARPYLVGADAMMVEVSFFEPVGSRSRLIGKGGTSAAITNPSKPSTFGGGTSGTLILGRKGYDVKVSARATYL